MNFLGKLASFALGVALVLGTTHARGGTKWQGSLEPVAGDSAHWQKLVRELMNSQLYFGALAASQRMLATFADLQAKELAYETIANLVDLGYPYDVLESYVAGDIEPKPGAEFGKSYYLYKGILNKCKGLTKWADVYFGRLDPEKFPRFKFYTALSAYSKGDAAKAEQLLLEILKTGTETSTVAFVRKVARTLARIYFEKQEYEKSLDIYSSFLLRLNPIRPSDWLEAAWNLYYLGRYEDALGYAYNLESESSRDYASLEKYVLRAVTYKKLCRTKNMQELLVQFKSRFRRAIDGIANTQSLTNIRELDQLEIPENDEFNKVARTLRELRAEQKNLDVLPRSVRALASYLYKTEVKLAAKRFDLYQEEARQRAAEYVVNMNESLKFLLFDIERSKLSPESLFQEEDPSKKLIESRGDMGFTLRWRQTGDFWRDERLKFRGVVKDQCGK